MKRITLLIVAFTTIFSIISGAIAASSLENEGDYEYLDSGNGVQITRYYGQDELLVIPQTLGGKIVTSIATSAFQECATLIQVTIPEGVTGIGSWAFASCTQLQQVTIPDSVTVIETSAFFDCHSLVSIEAGSNSTELVSVDGILYSKDMSILRRFPLGKTDTTFAVPEQVRQIAPRAFEYCGNLVSVTIPEGVVSIGDSAFAYCSNMVTVVLPDTLLTIDDNAFGNCPELTNVRLPANLQGIGGGAFNNCTNIGSLTIPNTVVNIGWGAFAATKLTEINIPAGVTSLTEDIFTALDGCSELRSIEVDPRNTHFSSIDGVLYSKDGQMLIHYPRSKGNQFVVPNHVTAIGVSAFKFCTNLESLSLPNGLIAIDKNAFQWCSGLKELSLPETLVSIGSNAFSFCQSLTEITVPDSVVTIEWGAFEYCTSLESITIPYGIKGIGSGAFSYCSSLSSISIPGSVTAIGYFAFANCAPELVIYGLPNSAAEDYAQRFDISFVPFAVEEMPVLSATVEGAIVFTIYSQQVTYGSTVLPDPPLEPQIINRRAMLPLRYLCETALGGYVHYNAEEQRIIAIANGCVLALSVDDPAVKVGQEVILLDQAPIIVDGYTMVPLGAFEKVVNSIEWDSASRTVIVKPVPEPTVAKEDNRTPEEIAYINSPECVADRRNQEILASLYTGYLLDTINEAEYVEVLRSLGQDERYIQEMIDNAASEQSKYTVTFPASDRDKTEFNATIYEIEPFDLSVQFPQGWTLRERDLITEYNSSIALSGVWSILDIFNEIGERVGGVGYNIYELYEGAEDDPRAIYNQIALGNGYHFDVRDIYRVIDETEFGKTAIADVYYSASINSGIEKHNKGILIYNRGLLVYVALEFDSNMVTDEQIESIARSLSIT